MSLACHAVHLILVFYGLLGWAVPDERWLIAHLIFIPTLVVVWRFNDNSCPLNNIESYVTTGRWRNPHSAEEGGFIRVVVGKYLGLEVTQTVMDRVTYGLMFLVWLLSWGHLWLLTRP